MISTDVKILAGIYYLSNTIDPNLCHYEIPDFVAVFKCFKGEQEGPVFCYEKIDAIGFEIRMIDVLPTIRCNFIVIGNAEFI